MSIDQYSQTPASNDLTGYGKTGMRPSAVKNAFWDVMADIAVLNSLPTSGGSANAQTVTNTRQYGALFTGMVVRWIPGFTSTGAMTLQVDGLSAKNLFANGVAAIAGMVVLNVPAMAVYDGTQFNLLNPSRVTSSFTLTLTGMSGATTVTISYAIDASGKSAQCWGLNQTGTSNATTMTGTGVPSVLSTATSKTILCRSVDSNTTALGYFTTGAGGTTWTFNNGVGTSNAYTASGVKGVRELQIVFTLD